MEPLVRVRGSAVVLDRSDVDTDQIISTDALKRTDRTGYAGDLFAAWRREDPDFALNRPGAAGAPVLLAGRNFGCGSSREHAVWALVDFGFGAVVSEKIADIFRGNAVNAGLVPVELPAAVVRRMMDAVGADPATVVEVDLEDRRVRVPAAGIDEPFALADSIRRRLLAGLDEIGLTLQHEPAIERYEACRPRWLPALDALDVPPAP